MALVRRVGALRAAEAVTSWLFVAIRNACLRRVPEVVLVPVEVAGDLAGADPTGGVVDRMVVAEALAALPAAYREVIMLADLLDSRWSGRPGSWASASGPPRAGCTGRGGRLPRCWGSRS
jgi:DNA-directed RNA polymerase specialized sigma24 family protein